MRSYAPDFDLIEPGTLDDVLQRISEGWRPIAGGTDLMVLFNAGRLRERRLVSLRQLQTLRAIAQVDGQLHIGAACTYSDLRRHALVCDYFPLLVQAASWTGGIANQNRGTLGGNIANASPAADSPPVLMVYEAILELTALDGSRRVPYAQFHTGYKTMDLRPGEVISRVILPMPHVGAWCEFGRKVGARRAQAISKVSFAGRALRRADGSLEMRLGLGSVAPTPLRCVATEELVAAEPLRPALIEEARRVLAQEISPIDDIRSTADYRLLVAQNVLTEFLGQLL